MAFLRTALITRIRESLEAGDRAAAERWLEEAHVSGVEEARLTPFREAAAGLPRSPAAQSPAPADPSESAPATPGPSEEEPAAAAPADATPVPVEPVPESQAPAEPVAPAATDAAAGDAAPQGDTTGDPAPVDEAAAAEAAVEEPAVTDDPAADTSAADGGPVAAVTADTAPAQAVSRGEEPAAADAAPPAQPERITYVPPSYPRAAEMRGVEGWVDVAFSLTAAGRPRAIEVTDARPADTFDQAALEAVSQWRYQPPAAGGWPADQRLRIRINFGLDP
jgi:protein TonB